MPQGGAEQGLIHELHPPKSQMWVYVPPQPTSPGDVEMDPLTV